GEPDRDADGDARGDRDRPRGGLHGGDVPPVGRDRGHHDRRPRGGDRLRPDKDRRALALGPGREVQPAAEDRGGAGLRRDLPGALRFQKRLAEEPAAARRSCPSMGSTSAAPRIDWTRASRLALVAMLLVIVFLYVQPITHWL